jgi:serine/threonine-protein kinase
VFGGSIAAPIWKDYMLAVMKGMPPREFPTADLVSIPYVVGKPVAEAAQILKDAGFRVQTRIVDSYLARGTVVAQQPTSSTTAVQGIVVHLDVSNGNAQKVTVPNVKGMSVSEAESALSPLHLFPTIVYSKTNDPSLDGVVYGINPDAGTTVLEGTGVTLLVWDGPASPSPSPGGGGGGGGGGDHGGGKGGHNGKGKAHGH